MKNHVYLFISVALMTFATGSVSAQTGMTGKKAAAIVSLAESNADSFNGLSEMPIRPAQDPNKRNQVMPIYDQINSEIRWYALENASNPKYWEGVNTERVWIVLEEGRSIDEPEISSMLLSHGLINIISESKRKHHINYWIFEMSDATPEQILALANDARSIDGVSYIEPSSIYTKSYTPNDPLYNQQWGPYVTYFDEAWDAGFGGNSWNVVAVIDDACDWNHEDLYDQVWYGYDYAENDGDIFPDDPYNHTHGTHTTGTVAATIGNGIGVAGMVNDTVYFAKVGLSDGTLSDEAIVNAIYDVGDIDRISAVNMSLGGDSPSAAIEQACNYAWNQGRILLVASGNNGSDNVGFPAAYPSCMAVGAIGTDGNSLYLTQYSQFGQAQEICAPGGDVNTGFGILSTYPLNQYESIEGTSMACPHVTGLAGLLKHINMDLTNVDIRNIISATAFDYGDQGWDEVFGYGMINASFAVQAVQGGTAVSVAEISGSDVMKLYPNPAANRILIDKKVPFENGVFEVYDMTGRQVKSQVIQPGKQAVIYLSDLPQGVYILKMKSEIGITSSRFVKA